MPKTLIVPIDGSEAAERGLDTALVLAAKFESCDIVLLAVDVDNDARMLPYLEQLAARHAGAVRGPVRVECATGDPAGEIVRRAQHDPDAVVCMTTRGRGRVAAPLLGSVATEVVRGIASPVLLVGPRCDADWWHDPAHLVACWVGTGSDPVLRPARAWSTTLGMDLSLVCVFHPLDVPASVEPARQFDPAVAQLDDLHGRVRTIDLHDDDPSRAITDYARDLPATLLAVTSHARSGFARIVLGSVAMDVVHNSPCPVLVVRRS